MATHLRNAGRIGLHEGAQTAESRVLLLVVANLVQCLAPCLSKLPEVGCDMIGMHQANTTNGHCGVLVKTSGRLGVQEDRNQPRDQRVDPLLEFRIV